MGDRAPRLVAKNQHNQTLSLDDFPGKRVLLVFFPFAFTPVCAGELRVVRDDLARFQNDQVQVLPVSVDHPFALKAWAAQEGFEFPLLSDFWPHGAIARSYGVLNEQAGFAVRGTFLIDPDGIVRFREVNEPGQPRDAARWRDAIDALG